MSNAPRFSRAKLAAYVTAHWREIETKTTQPGTEGYFRWCELRALYDNFELGKGRPSRAKRGTLTRYDG